LDGAAAATAMVFDTQIRFIGVFEDELGARVNGRYPLGVDLGPVVARGCQVVVRGR
jgi:hypothetical protein